MKGSRQGLPWSDDVRRQDSEERARFIESHVDLVRYLALRINSRIPVALDMDDLVHEGIVGLLDAVERFDPSRGASFKTYAEARVRGAMLDSLRQKDWRPRSIRVMQRDLDVVVRRLSSTHGRAATEEEIADGMGMDIDALRRLLEHTRSGPMLSLHELPASSEPIVKSEDQLPHELLEKRDMIQALSRSIEKLPERERRVLELYYHEGMNMKEVGAVLGVTESRVCQLHGQAAARLRGLLREMLHARSRTPRAEAAGGGTGKA